MFDGRPLIVHLELVFSDRVEEDVYRELVVAVACVVEIAEDFVVVGVVLLLDGGPVDFVERAVLDVVELFVVVDEVVLDDAIIVFVVTTVCDLKIDDVV